MFKTGDEVRLLDEKYNFIEDDEFIKVDKITDSQSKNLPIEKKFYLIVRNIFSEKTKIDSFEPKLEINEMITKVTDAKNNLIKNLKLSTSKIAVIPVPISQKLLLSKKLNGDQRPRSIALIGRIHGDRGIWRFIDLVNKLNRVSQDFDVIVIGSGQAETEFVAAIKNIIPRQRLKIFGQISEDSLAKMWSKIGVLVSLAPVESYGRAIREAFISSIPVWVSKSSGALDLISTANSKGIKLIDLNHSDKALLREFEKLLVVKSEYNLRRKLFDENKGLSSLLVKSWLELIK
jgi:glycosyltransferase involved in cell wall biosynthesis